MVRVRYAPAPTGTLHIGGARTALFNYLFARHHEGVFVLRLEDTDTAREVAGSAEGMIAGLRALGLTWQEGPDVGGAYGPYLQSERMSRYQAALDHLERTGRAYRCYCTPGELEALRVERRQAGLPPRYMGTCRHLTAADHQARRDQPYVLRLRVPDEGQTVVQDLIRGTVVFENSVLDDFVIRKSNGSPIYNLAVVVDDVEMEITHVIRAEEHLSNTPKQILVAEAMGWKIPQYAHVPMVLAPDRSKLSKRHGATSVAEYQALGILPEALVNYLNLLGWSPPGDTEIFTLDEAAQWFELDRVQLTAAIYDQKKLEWMNAQYLRRLPPARVFDACRPFLRDLGIDPDASAPPIGNEGAVMLVRERARTLKELAEGMAFLYRPVTSYDEKGASKYFSKETASRLSMLALAAESQDNWSAEGLEALFTALSEQWQIPRASLIHPTRLALTGTTVGPGLFELMAALAPQQAAARLRQAAAVAANRD